MAHIFCQPNGNRSKLACLSCRPFTVCHLHDNVTVSEMWSLPLFYIWKTPTRLPTKVTNTHGSLLPLGIEPWTSSTGTRTPRLKRGSSELCPGVGRVISIFLNRSSGNFCLFSPSAKSQRQTQHNVIERLCLHQKPLWNIFFPCVQPPRPDWCDPCS